MATVTLYPTGDSEVQDDSPNFNNGGADALGSGEEDITATTYRSFIQFDLSPYGRDVVVTAASLLLTISSNNSSNVRTKRIRVVTSSWTELGVTWNNQPSYSTELGSLSFGTSDSGQKTFTLSISEIQKYMNGTVTNNGFAVITDSENDDHYQFHSRENGTQGNRPQLVLTYYRKSHRSQII